MKNVFFSVLFLLPIGLYAQGSGSNPGMPADHILDRLDISGARPAGFDTAIRPYLRGDLARYAMALDTLGQTTRSRLDSFDIYYLLADNNEWINQPVYPTTIGGRREQAQSRSYDISRKPILKTFYRTPAHLFEVDKPFFHLRANPILYLWGGTQSGDTSALMINQRGVEIRGGVDDRIFFYTNVLETQLRFPRYVNDRVMREESVPGAGLFKPYRSRIFEFEDGYDFLLAQGYLGFNVTKHVGVQFGHGRNFIGHGYRSLMLSDFANNYLYLKLNWRVWKLHLQNIYTELAGDDDPTTGLDPLRTKRYMTAHYLSFQPTPNFSIGLFEAVIFNRDNHFELHYLNPLILYRAVEQVIGSPDNVILGLQGHWNLFRRFQLYGQLVFDEFKFDELFIERRGWWANKYGIQGGLKYINVLGINHLDAQVEINYVRPFTYSHFDSLSSYHHYNQPLAHPLGANFREGLVRLRYQPAPRLVLQVRYLNMLSGEDGLDENWGGNLLLPNRTRELDYGNEVGQGVRAEIDLFGADIQYMFWHNMFLEFNVLYRNKRSQDPARSDEALILGGGVRINIARQQLDF